VYPTSVETTSETLDELTGPVLEVLPKLLAQGRTDEALEAVRVLVKRNEQLERQLAALGRRSMKANEGVSTTQLLLLLDELSKQQAEADRDPELAAKKQDELLHQRAEAAAERARQKALVEGAKPKCSPLKKPLPPELPRRDNVIEVPEAERACPCCGDTRAVIGHDISEVLELTPAQLYVRRDKREKRACQTCEAAVVRAPRGDKIVAGGQLGCSIGAQIVYDKYDLGLPLHRQRRTFKRMGMKLSSSTLADQVKWVAELLRPLWLEAIDQVLASNVMHLDGTGINVLDRAHPNGKRNGTIWSTTGARATKPEVAAYFYASTKKAKGQHPGEHGPSDILALRTGIIVVDMDMLFVEQCKREDLIDCACNMHARRYFVKALDSGDTRAALVLGAFKELYQIEDEVRDASEAERLAARRERSTPCYDDIVKWCVVYERNTPPKTPLGRAIRYLLKHQVALRRFEGDGAIPIDNMAAEHNFVSVALTRKNFLFAGSDAGGERAAIVYTILRCCRLAGVDPVEYLTDVLAVLSRKIRRVDVPKLMPAAWAKNRGV
jgi:transposase